MKLSYPVGVTPQVPQRKPEGMARTDRLIDNVGGNGHQTNDPRQGGQQHVSTNILRPLLHVRIRVIMD